MAVAKRQLGGDQDWGSLVDCLALETLVGTQVAVAGGGQSSGWLHMWCQKACHPCRLGTPVTPCYRASWQIK